MTRPFLLYPEHLTVLEELTDEQAGKLAKAINCYVCYNDEKNIKLDAITRVAFAPIKAHLDKDRKRYEDICKKRAEAGSKGGKQKVANASKSKQRIANLANNKNNSSKKDKDKSLSKKGTRLPEDWRPSNDLYNWAEQELGIPSYDAGYETEKFRDYWQSQSGQKGIKLDWDKTWRNWMRRVREQNPKQRNTQI